MEEKKNKGIYIVAAILLFLTVLLLILTGMLFLDGKEDKPGDSRNAGPFVKKEDKTVSAMQENGRTEREGVEFVLGGYKMTVPKAYSCTYAEGIGPIVYVDGEFQMKFMAKEESFEEMMKKSDDITKKTLEQGGKIVKKVQEKELDGGKYLYFRAELEGSSLFVAHTGDGERHFASQAVIGSEEMTDEKLLGIFADIVKTAQKTDTPDSTGKDIFGQTAAPDYGTAKSESSISFAGETVKFQVPDGFYSTWTAKTDSYRTETFQTKEYLCVDCSLWSTKNEGDYPNAKVYIDTMLDFVRNGVKDGIKTDSIKIEGNTCYYIDLHYTYAGTDYQYIYAACDYGRNGMYTVKATGLDLGEELSVETIREFFNTMD